MRVRVVPQPIRGSSVLLSLSPPSAFFTHTASACAPSAVCLAHFFLHCSCCTRRACSSTSSESGLRARMTGPRSPMTFCVHHGEVYLCLSVNVIVRFNDISLKCPLPKIKGHRRKANYQSQLTFVTDPFFSCFEHFDTFIPTLPGLLLYLTRWWSQIAAVQPVHLQRSGVAAATGSLVSACCMLNQGGQVLSSRLPMQRQSRLKLSYGSREKDDWAVGMPDSSDSSCLFQSRYGCQWHPGIPPKGFRLDCGIESFSARRRIIAVQ